MTKLQYYYSWKLLNYFLSNFGCFSNSVLTRWNYSLLFQNNRRSLWLCLCGPQQWQSSSWCVKFSKCTAPFYITYKLGQMMEIPLGMHLGTIRLEKFHTKTVSILSFLMFEKCRLCENYPKFRCSILTPSKIPGEATLPQGLILAYKFTIPALKITMIKF